MAVAHGLPALRAVPYGEAGIGALLLENVAAAVLVAVVFFASPTAGGRVRFFAVGWAVFVLGAVVAGVFRGVVAAQTVEAGLGAYAGHLLGGVVGGVVWGVVLGWMCGIGALVGRAVQPGVGAE
ncbi:hypothetical protein [Sinosporangium album]|nr:hypothetical protein [Sinosporangium album]